MKQSIGLYLFFVAHYIITVICDDQLCTVDNRSTCNGEQNENKYNRELNQKYWQFFENIRKAKESYKPCDATKCKCHSNVINEDLNKFKNGITKELIENVKSKGTKYQIIKHRLYRDPDCMFPARCTGIEHFILELLDDLPDMEIIVNTRDWPQIHKQYGAFGPVFSFSKSNEYYDIMYPAWAFWEGGPAIELYPRGIGEEVKIIWEKLRRCYINAIRRREREKLRNGQSAKKMFPWKYELQMSFILPFVADKKLFRFDSTNFAPDGFAEETNVVQKSNEIKSEPEECGDFHLVENEFPESYPNIDDEWERPSSVKKWLPMDLRELDDTDMFFLSMSGIAKKLSRLEQSKIKLILSEAVIGAEIKDAETEEAQN